MHLKIGSYLQGGKYRIEKVLGQGGFGITYLAVQTNLKNRKVAIKEFFLKEHCERDSSTSQVSMGTSGSKDLVSKFKNKFVKEAETISELRNHHIITIFDVFEENGTAYYVMEYLSCGSLAERIPSNGFPESEAVGYIRQVADALSYIHENKILHLDIKPSNILFRKADEAVLIDFGISKHYDEAGSSQTSSTPVGVSRGYAPLEQYKSGGVAQFNPATDIYSLGATLYKLLTGQTPPDADEVNEEGLSGIPSSASASTRTAVEQAMSPKRKDRPQSVEDFMNHLFVQKDEFDIDRTSICEEQSPVEVENQEVLSFNEEHLPVPDSTSRIRFRDRKLFQNLSKLLIGMAVVINIYGLFVVFDITNYQNMTYPHVLLLCLLVLFTSIGVSAVWLLNLNYKRSKLMKTVFMLLLLSAGVLNSYLFAFDMPYIVKDDDCDNVYIRKWGMMPSDHDDKYMVQGDIIPFKQWGKYGLKNGSTGEVVLSPRYDYISFYDVATKMYDEDEGEWYSNYPEYDKENNVIFEVERDGKHGVLNVKGDVVVPIVYDYWESLRDSDNMYIVGKEGRYGIITKQNKVILPLDYSKIDYYDSNNSYILASKNGFWGVIDLKNRIYVPFEYDGIDLPDNFGDELDSGMENTLFAYKRNGYWGVKDTSGKEYLSCEYGGIPYSSIEDYLSYGYWVVEKAGKQGVLNSIHEVIIPFEYDKIWMYGSQYGLFVVSNYHKRKGWMEGVINVNNEVILPIKEGSIYIDESVIVRESNYREKEVYNHLGERIN